MVGVLAVVACGSDDGDSRFGDGTGTTDAGMDGSDPFSPGFGDTDGAVPGPGEEEATDVEAVITADNAYSFGYGDVAGLKTFFQGEGSDSAGIFSCPVGLGPVAYKVAAADAPTSAYLYIIAWADRSTTQGTLAQFRRVGGKTLYSGDANWEVCAVGREYQTSSKGPDQGTVNADIAACNAGATADAGATYSHGWVTKDVALTAGARGRLAVGEANDDPDPNTKVGEFPQVCQRDADGVEGINAAARWMWFATNDPQDTKPSWFTNNDDNRTKSYLVFRLPASKLPPGTVK